MVQPVCLWGETVIIDRNVTPYVVFGEDSVLTALQKITANEARIVFSVDEHGHLRGALSDGDFRRWLLSHPDADLNAPVSRAANPSVTSVQEGTPTPEIAARFRKGVDRIPVVDERGRMVAIATQGRQPLVIGRHTIGDGSPALLIAEIGNNHQGSVDLAKELVDLAADSGADLVKFQLRDMDALYRGDAANRTAGEDLGPQYTMNLLAKYNLTADQMIEVLDHCKLRDLDAIVTPWDLPSARVLADYGIPGFKIASADVTNHPLVRAVAAFHRPMIVSTGMSTEPEIVEAIEVIRGQGAPFALLQCQSTYPAPFKDVNLRYMDRLAELGDCPVGYSGHERGWHIALAAVARGAKIVEKHFTIDKELEGNDHQVSLLPGEFAQMAARIRELEQALGSAGPRSVSTGEMMNRINLAKSLIATRDLAVGDTITTDAVDIKSPGRGLQPNHLDELVGRRAKRTIASGDFFYPGDLSDAVSEPRAYAFRRPWGIPVRYHDHAKLIETATPDFLEFHLSYKDVEADPRDFFTAKLPMGHTVHTPDLYAGDFLINLASDDDAVWERSIVETQKVIQIARDLQEWFTDDQPPVVICTMGGFTKDAFVPREARPALYDRIGAALERIDASGVRLTAQTLPPFPWLMGGQQYHNLFLEPEDTIAFCEKFGARLTLDISHTKLSANFYRQPLSAYVEALAPYVDHLHIVDATGVDGEGPQIGDGEVDWPELADQLDRLLPGVGFIPEIWMGHVNNGEGFWTALDRLEQWF